MNYVLLSAEPVGDGGEIRLVAEVSEGRHTQTIKGEISLEFYKELGLSAEFFVPVQTDEETFKSAEFLMRKTEAVKKGMDLLSFSQNTKKALAEKLKLRGFDRECAEQASQYLADNGFIDEKQSAKMLAEDMAIHGKYGEIRIANALYTKGFERSAIDYAIKECDVDFASVCIERIESMGGVSIFADKQTRIKAVSALSRYGFSYDEIKTAVTVLSKKIR